MFPCIGEYGIVYKGRVTCAVDKSISQVIAVKTLKGNRGGASEASVATLTGDVNGSSRYIYI